MPELPEVETVRRGVEPHVLGRRITAVVVRDARLRWPVPADLAGFAKGRTITATSRRGKYLLLHLGDASDVAASIAPSPQPKESGYSGRAQAPVAGSGPGDCWGSKPVKNAVGAGDRLIIHLGMSGRLKVLPQGTPLIAHDHLDLVLDDGLLLRYHDPRRFGAVLPWPGAQARHPLMETMGPEPFSEAFSGDYLFARSRGKTTAVKTFLMDGGVVVGAGNIYAAESLFRAGIRPTRPAGRVSRAEYQRLADTVRQVLASAIEQGGTTLRDFAGANGEAGYFQQDLYVYGRENRPCRVCSTPIKLLRLGNRQSCYCPTCQR